MGNKKSNRKRKNNKIVDIIISNVITLIFLFVFVIMVFCVYCSMTDKIPNVFGYQMLRIVTGSMEPEYPTNSYVVAKSVDSNTLKVGDVISFYSRDEAIRGKVNTHRIKRIIIDNNQKKFVTKGDANKKEDDSLVEPGDLVGKVIFKAKIIDWVGAMLHKQWIYFFIIIIPLAVMLIIEMKNVVKASLALKNETTNNEKKEQTEPNNIQDEELKKLVDKFGTDILEMVKNGEETQHKATDQTRREGFEEKGKTEEEGHRTEESK